jgi:hypothetical protein
MSITIDSEPLFWDFNFMRLLFFLKIKQQQKFEKNKQKECFSDKEEERR